MRSVTERGREWRKRLRGERVSAAAALVVSSGGCGWECDSGRLEATRR